MLDIDTADLFDDDLIFRQQDEEAAYMEKVNKAISFLGYHEQNTCQNCRFREDGKCFVLKEYNGVVFETTILGKCKHYKKQVAE